MSHLKRIPYRFTTCNTKVRYVGLRDAIGAADSYMERVALTRRPMLPYYCPVHSSWHIGHSRRDPAIGTVAYSLRCVDRARLRRSISRWTSILEKLEVAADAPQTS